MGKETLVEQCSSLAYTLRARAKGVTTAAQPYCQRLVKSVGRIEPLLTDLGFVPENELDGNSLKILQTVLDELRRAHDVVERAASMGLCRAALWLQELVISMTTTVSGLHKTITGLQNVRFDSAEAIKADAAAVCTQLALVEFVVPSRHQMVVARIHGLSQLLQRRKASADAMHQQLLESLLELLPKDVLLKEHKQEMDDLKSAVKAAAAESDAATEFLLQQVICALQLLIKPAPGPPAQQPTRASLDEAPAAYVCPISRRLMVDPVIVASTGMTYERQSIEEWWARDHDTCPLTGAAVSDKQLIPNWCLKTAIASWARNNGVAWHGDASMPATHSSLQLPHPPQSTLGQSAKRTSPEKLGTLPSALAPIPPSSATGNSSPVEQDLLDAACCGNMQLVDAYLDRGARLEATDARGRTALLHAIAAGHSQLALSLLRRGADVRAANAHGSSALHLAAGQGMKEVVEEVLEKQPGGHALRDSTGSTPLHLAASNGHYAVVRLLLDAGADLHCTNGSNSTVLHLAAANRHRDLAVQLLSRGTKLEAKDNSNWTPLHWAAAMGHADMAEMLVNNGADITAADLGNKRPADVIGLLQDVDASQKAALKMLLSPSPSKAAPPATPFPPPQLAGPPHPPGHGQPSSSPPSSQYVRPVAGPPVRVTHQTAAQPLPAAPAGVYGHAGDGRPPGQAFPAKAPPQQKDPQARPPPAGAQALECLYRTFSQPGNQPPVQTAAVHEGPHAQQPLAPAEAPLAQPAGRTPGSTQASIAPAALPHCRTLPTSGSAAPHARFAGSLHSATLQPRAPHVPAAAAMPWQRDSGPPWRSHDPHRPPTDSKTPSSPPTISSALPTAGTAEGTASRPAHLKVVPRQHSGSSLASMVPSLGVASASQAVQRGWGHVPSGRRSPSSIGATSAAGTSMILQRLRPTGKPRLDSLFSSLLDPGCTKEVLDLKWQSIGLDGTKALATVISHNTSVRRLNFCGNKPGLKGVAYLCRALTRNSTLLEVDLSECDLGGGDGVVALASVLRTNTCIASLKLYNSHIGLQGLIALARMLEHNTAMHLLDVGGNQLGPEAGQAIAEALRQNTTLTSLDLRSNRLTKSGIMFVAGGCQENTTLKHLMLEDNATGAFLGFGLGKLKKIFKERKRAVGLRVTLN